MTKIRSFLLAFAVLAGTVGATAAPALADDWNHRDARYHDWHRYHAPVFYAGTPYAYPYEVPAPAPVYVPPPSPVVYGAPAANLSIMIPFHL
ncbi:MAG TPA: hypothetical protein VLV50_16495 [Stellaceae bacterium]|nr:hypothetical protein [Stellaceae bacterium]